MRGLPGLGCPSLVAGAVTLVVPVVARAQDGDGGGLPLGVVIAGAVIVAAIGLYVMLPRLRPLNGRLVVRDAFGPSVFATASLSAVRSWNARDDLDAIPSREGLLVGLGIKRGLSREIEVTLRFKKGGQIKEVIAGRLAPGQKEQVNDLVIDYDGGQNSAAVS